MRKKSDATDVEKELAKKRRRQSRTERDRSLPSSGLSPLIRNILIGKSIPRSQSYGRLTHLLR